MELRAVTAAALKVTLCTNICRDSNYVLDGITEEAYGSRRNDWCGSKGRVPNAMISESLLQVINLTSHLIKWVWSPGIAGNWQEDKLAKRAHSPSISLLAPAARAASCSLPSPDVPRKPATSRILLLGQGDVSYLQVPPFTTPSTIALSSGYTIMQLLSLWHKP